MANITSVNIRPGVNTLSVLPHLNYKAWFALAEFVDNSIQSSVNNRDKLDRLVGGKFKLRVDIDLNSNDNLIIIKDNAAGISQSDYERAFRTAEVPPNSKGLSEFGMGMKSASFWFAKNWKVKSSALGEDEERIISFDMEKIVAGSVEILPVNSTIIEPEAHFTEVHLENIRRFPKGKTIAKIKEHLSNIYRVFMRNDEIELFLDGEQLKFEEPKVLHAPTYKKVGGKVIVEDPKVDWKTEIKIDLGEGKSAGGFVALRETGNTRLAGLAMFRRNRLIFGSADETYRPEDIFGRGNSFASQRLFGEIHLEGFTVPHTKDGIQWEDDEIIFIKKLRELLRDGPLPMLQQANNYSSKKDAISNRNSANQALNNIADQLTNTEIDLQDIIAPQTDNSEEAKDPDVAEKLATEDHKTDDNAGEKSKVVSFSFPFSGQPWLVTMELSYENVASDWFSIQNTPSISDPDPRKIDIRLSMLHPFMAQFSTLDDVGLRPIFSIVASMALAEVLATELNKNHPSVIRQFSNNILKNLLSQPTG